MSWPVPAETLMTGPRGRYLCWSLLSSAMSDSVETGAWDRIWDSAQAGDLSDRVGDLAATVARAHPGALAAAADELVLMPALADTAAMAMYWEEPDPVDWALTDSQVQNALLPIASAVAESPGARWWQEPVALDTQQYVEWEGADRRPILLSGADQELATWRSATREEERSAAQRPADPAANWSGHWWSAPTHSRLTATTRDLPSMGAVGLALVEDGLGWTSARSQPVSVRAGTRVYEINGPEDWARLTARYPLDVTRSRRHDWWRVTGWAGTWVIPDYTAVAAEYDAIHVTVLGYLTTAGRDLPAGQARTLLAGWNPDTTYWLTDSLALAGPATRLEQRDDNPVSWIRVGGDAGD
jgi:hypothetical protein